MKRISIIMVVLALSGSVLFAGGLSYGINGELAMPMGDFGDMANMGFGGTVQGEYAINEQIIGTASAGYLMWSGKDAWEDMDYSWTCIPIKAGAKYAFGPLYGIFELGIYMFSFEFDYEFMGYSISGDDSSSEFGFAPGIGYQMKLGEKMKLDLSIQYEIAGDFDLLGIDIGIRF